MIDIPVLAYIGANGLDRYNKKGLRPSIEQSNINVAGYPNPVGLVYEHPAVGFRNISRSAALELIAKLPCGRIEATKPVLSTDPDIAFLIFCK